MRIPARSALYGGALLVACTSSVTYGQWTIDPSNIDDTTTIVSVASTSGVSIDYFEHGFGDISFDLDSYNAPDIGGSVRAAIDSFGISAHLDINAGQNGMEGYGNALVIVEARVIATANFRVLAEWDFVNYSVDGGGILRVYDLTSDLPYPLFEMTEPGTSGSQLINIEAGHEYVLRAGVGSSTSAHLYASLTNARLPAPGTLCLLCVSAMGRRHRRRAN